MMQMSGVKLLAIGVTAIAAGFVFGYALGGDASSTRPAVPGAAASQAGSSPDPARTSDADELRRTLVEQRQELAEVTLEEAKRSFEVAQLRNRNGQLGADEVGEVRVAVKEAEVALTEAKLARLEAEAGR